MRARPIKTYNSLINLITKQKGIEAGVYEPVLTKDEFINSPVIKDLEDFKKDSDVIIANRKSDDLAGVDAKIFNCDLSFTT